MSSFGGHRQEEKFLVSALAWVFPVVFSLFLIVISQVNYVLFHTLAELFAVIVAILMFVVAWQMFAFTRNSFLILLGVGYFWIGILDVSHTLSFKGMSLLGDAKGNSTVQFWIMTRYLEGFVVLIAPLYLNRMINYRVWFIVFGVYAFLVHYLVLNEMLPVMYIEGEGLTVVKVVSEYLIISSLLAAAFILWRKSQFIDRRILHAVLGAIVLTISAELCFTIYIDLYGISNIAGHIFKLFSYWLVFIAMVRTTLQEPFTVMSRGANTYDAVPDATILVNSKGLIYQVNQAACQMVNIEREQLLGQPVHDYFHPHQLAEGNCPVCEKMQSGLKISGLEIEDSKRNIWLDFSLSPVVGLTDIDGSVEVIRDITQRKIIEQELDDVNELKDSIVANLPAMLFVKRAKDHRYVEWNKAAEELTGLIRDEMLGKNDYDFFSEEEASYYIDMDTKVLSEGVMHDIPEEPIHTRFKGVRLLHTRKIPIFNTQGQANYLLGISEDITKKRETEEMLRRSQKMEAVGQLSGGIAHDFNNQLGIVTGYLEFLKVYVNGQEKQEAWVSNAIRAANRCVELTRQLLLFSRAKPSGKSNVDINQTITNIEDMIEKSVTPEVDIQYQLDPALKQIAVDESEFEDAIVNMVLNSRDAMPDGGKLVIRTSNIYLDNDFVVSSPGVKTGEYCVLEIKDNGIGMNKEVLEHIFEPFYTTKSVGKGTGLGMSMVYSFVQRYDGSINIDSVPGAGTTVKLYIPRTVDEETEDNSDVVDSKHIVSLPQGKETILIVDDEVDLLNLASDYFSGLGYRPIKASTADEALNILGREKVDIVFTDIVMPGGMNGYELADEVRNLYPEIKVLLTSGYTGKSTGTVYKSVYKELIVAKPYTQQDLAYRIRAVLDS